MVENKLALPAALILGILRLSTPLEGLLSLKRLILYIIGRSRIFSAQTLSLDEITAWGGGTSVASAICRLLGPFWLVWESRLDDSCLFESLLLTAKDLRIRGDIVRCTRVLRSEGRVLVTRLNGASTT